MLFGAIYIELLTAVVDGKDTPFACWIAVGGPKSPLLLYVDKFTLKTTGLENKKVLNQEIVN